MSREELGEKLATSANDYLQSHIDHIDADLTIADMADGIADLALSLLPPMDDGGLRKLLSNWFEGWLGEIVNDPHQQPELFPMMRRASLLTLKALYPERTKDIDEDIRQKITALIRRQT